MAKHLPPTTILSADEARAYLVGQLGLRRRVHPVGASGVRALLAHLRCIQLDPLDPWGTNADLVALARLENITRGEIFTHLFPGHAFEHFAKERCLLPASAFPYYRQRSIETPWWRLRERHKRLARGVVEAVHEEIKARGPLTAAALTDQGKVKPIDWAGWKGTSRAATMALEVLWTRCEVVVCGRDRRGRGKLYDIPERALPSVAEAPAGDFERWAMVERVEAAGLLSRNSGPQWSMLTKTRLSKLPDRLVAEGVLEAVQIEKFPRRYLAPAGFRSRSFPKSDGDMRVLGPLDPLIWDRRLVRDIFGFDYVWEVYKPESQRRWGWYVCPLFQNDRLVGRVEGLVEKEQIKVRRIWKEQGTPLDEEALDVALQRHARACSVESVSRPKRILLS